jgi:hypothetical protein
MIGILIVVICILIFYEIDGELIILAGILVSFVLDKLTNLTNIPVSIMVGGGKKKSNSKNININQHERSNVKFDQKTLEIINNSPNIYLSHISEDAEHANEF